MTRPWANLLIVALGAVAGVAQSGRPISPFTDVTAESGLDFVHVNGATGELLLPEVMGAGGALFDYDNDGDLDLFLVQGAPLNPVPGSATSSAFTRPRSRLYRNDLQVHASGARTVRFVDVTDASRIVATGYGMGAATGDYDNDGWVDLYVTNLGSNQMLRNNGDGTFTDVTAATRTDDARWSASATFFDYDQDGWLDLFVTNYVRFTKERRECFSKGSARDYCNPQVYEPVPSRLLHNNGNGTFSDVSVRSGITRVFGRGLGVIAADLNADGWIDLYVANDGDPNQLWINEAGAGRFTDQGLLAGVALNAAGQPEGSMGVDAADFDEDGDDDLFVTNLDNETNTLYANVGKGLFEDRTIAVGLFQPSLGFTGFGTRFFDYDNDGWLDLFVANGAVRHLESLVRQGDPYPLGQRNQLFRNDNGRRFTEVSRTVGRAFEALRVGRGAAFGDLDNDGDTDIVVFNNNGPARVLLNTLGSRRHWLGVRVIAAGSRRDAFNARIELVQPRGGSRWRRVHTDGSYASASDPRVLFGLGDDGRPGTLRVQWPGGRTEEFRDLKVDQYWVLESGKPPRTK